MLTLQSHYFAEKLRFDEFFSSPCASWPERVVVVVGRLLFFQFRDKFIT